MTEEEGEIEYLDEDEDLVQQYVQSTYAQDEQMPVIQDVKTIADSEDIEDQIAPLLVERKPTQGQRVNQQKRRYKTEEDSDYDPSEDLVPQRKKKKYYPPKKSQVKDVIPVKFNLQKQVILKPKTLNNPPARTYVNKLKNLPNLTVKKQPNASTFQKPLVVKEVRTTKPAVKPTLSYSLSLRKRMDIKISDFEDPLCLPVRAIKKDEQDLKKLRHWNNLCLEHFKKTEKILKPDRGKTVKSSRTVVLRNVKNRYGKIETTIWGKNIVENEHGEKTTENFQSVLPKYREKKILPSYPLHTGNPKQVKHTYEAILAKEEQKDGDVLVVYKPREAVSAVYRLLEKNKFSEDMDQEDEEAKPCEMKEVTCCRVCAPCYQASWRGVRKRDTNNVICRICKRSFVSVYNLLSHLKSTHTPEDVRRHRALLSKTLASVVDYHYKCRICQEHFNSIKLLRKHVTKHQGMEVFRCEVGNHMAS